MLGVAFRGCYKVMSQAQERPAFQYTQMYPPIWALLLEGSPTLSWKQDSAMGFWGHSLRTCVLTLCPPSLLLAGLVGL